MNIRNIGAKPATVMPKVTKTVNIPFDMHCTKCGFYGEYVKIDDVFEYVMENMYDAVREAVSEQECENHYE